MKTALTELIEIIESSKQEADIQGFGICEVLDYHGLHDKATELLEKEREQIEEYANQQPEVERDIKWLQERVPELKDEGKAYFVKLALQYQSEDYEETIEELRMLTATATANSITEKKQPEQGEVEELKKDANYISDYWKSKVSFRDSAEQELFELAYTIGVQSEREAEKKRDVKKSTLTQDKVREAAEKVVEVYRNAIQEETRTSTKPKEMKNTPLQNLILKLVDKKDEHQFNLDGRIEYDDGVRRGLALAIVNARELLKEEKQVIVDAYYCGDMEYDKVALPSTRAEKYFNETYQNKEDE
jgi:hypothetical protein